MELEQNFTTVQGKNVLEQKGLKDKKHSRYSLKRNDSLNIEARNVQGLHGHGGHGSKACTYS